MTTEARLRAFVAVAETGSVRAAAQRLVVTELAVSAAVSALTRDVGAPLLERQGRGLRLTPAGLTYAGYARTILGLHEEALAAARGDADPAKGQVRLAAVTTAGEHVLPVVLASFRAAHPGIQLGLEVGTRDHVWGLLAAHEADLVIAGRGRPRWGSSSAPSGPTPWWWSVRPRWRVTSIWSGPPGSCARPVRAPGRRARRCWPPLRLRRPP